MIMNGSHGDRRDPGALCAEHIGIDLVAHECGLLRSGSVAGHGLPDAACAGLGGMRHAGNVILLREMRHALLMAVGDDAKRDACILHPGDPVQKRLLRPVRRVGKHGVVKVHQQQTDAVLTKKRRADLRDGLENEVR